MPELRPMRDDDVHGVHELAIATFEDLGRRIHEPVPEHPRPGDLAAAHVRLRRILSTDPAGCWVAEDARGLGGAGLAVLREGLWGLSLLIVRPDLQSAGIGSALLARTLEYGASARGGIVLASPDARALRAYARAGFALHPSLTAKGAPHGMIGCAEVRPFDPADHELAAAVDRRLRGAPHGGDLDALADGGNELLTHPGRGYAVHHDGTVKTIAAFDDEAAAALLRTVLARTPPGAEAEVAWLTGAQRWAIDVAVAARLELTLGGAVCLRGDVGPLQPYLPGGAYL